MLDIALGDDLRTRFSVAVANREPHLVGPLMQTEGVLLGLADSGRARRSVVRCLLRNRSPRHVDPRSRRLLGGSRSAQAHGEPAAFLEPPQSRVLAPGMAADICVFDPDTVRRGRFGGCATSRLTASDSSRIERVASGMCW